MQQRGPGLLPRGVESLLDAGQAVDEAGALAQLGADAALEHDAGDPVLPHRRGKALSGALGVGVRVGQRPVVRVHPVDRVDITGRVSDVGRVALVADGQVDPVAQLGLEVVGVAQQQAGTYAGLAEQPHDVRPDVTGRGGDGDRHDDLLAVDVDHGHLGRTHIGRR